MYDQGRSNKQDSGNPGETEVVGYIGAAAALLGILEMLRRWVGRKPVPYKETPHVTDVEGKDRYAERAAKLVAQYDSCIVTVRSSMIAHYRGKYTGYFAIACDELREALLNRRFKEYKAMISLPRCRSDFVEGRMAPIDYRNRLENLKQCLRIRFQYQDVPIFYPPRVKVVPSGFSHIVQIHLYYNKEDKKAKKGTLLLMLQGIRGDMDRGITLSRAPSIISNVKTMLEEWWDSARSIAVKRAEECGYDGYGEKKNVYKKYKRKMYPDLSKLRTEQEADLKTRIWLVEECIPGELEWKKQWEKQKKGLGEDCVY